jgi:hypothetical protein
MMDKNVFVECTSYKVFRRNNHRFPGHRHFILAVLANRLKLDPALFQDLQDLDDNGDLFSNEDRFAELQGLSDVNVT